MAAISVVYDHDTIASIGIGEEVTLWCRDLRMRTNVLVTFGYDGQIKYGEQVTDVKGGQIAILHCKDLKALNNIVIEAVGFEAYEHFYLTDKLYLAVKEGKVVLFQKSPKEDIDG